MIIQCQIKAPSVCMCGCFFVGGWSALQLDISLVLHYPKENRDHKAFKVAAAAWCLQTNKSNTMKEVQQTERQNKNERLGRKREGRQAKDEEGRRTNDGGERLASQCWEGLFGDNQFCMIYFFILLICTLGR